MVIDTEHHWEIQWYQENSTPQSGSDRNYPLLIQFLIHIQDWTPTEKDADNQLPQMLLCSIYHSMFPNDFLEKRRLDTRQRLFNKAGSSDGFFRREYTLFSQSTIYYLLNPATYSPRPPSCLKEPSRVNLQVVALVLQNPHSHPLRPPYLGNPKQSSLTLTTCFSNMKLKSKQAPVISSVFQR